MKILAALFFSILFGIAGLQDAEAQLGGIYAAPGMPVKAQRIISPATKTIRQKPHIVSPVFVRYWHQADSQQIINKQVCMLFVNRQSRFPATSLSAGVGGQLKALLTVLPDGKVGNVKIISRVMDAIPAWPTKTTSNGADLNDEVVRVMSQLRFEPASKASDTITVWQRFRIE
jgi:hypothetical protein